jgi:hypothetical protein
MVDCLLNDCFSILEWGKVFSSVYFLTSAGAHPASDATDTGEFLRQQRAQPGCDADHSLPLKPSSYLYSPNSLHGVFQGQLYFTFLYSLYVRELKMPEQEKVLISVLR